MTSVIINDYVIDRRIPIVLQAQDFVVAERLMSSPEPDDLLMQLQDWEVFRGRTRIRDLEPHHLKLLIEMNLKKVAEIKGEDVSITDPVVKSLIFLIEVLILCLEKRTQATVEVLKINRVGHLESVIEFASVLSMEELPSKKKTKKKGGIKVVVDNT